MAALLGLEARAVRDAILNTLSDLHLAQAALAKDRPAARTRAKAITLTLLGQHNAARLKQIDQQLAAIDAKIIDQISADPVLAARMVILVSIPGIAAGKAPKGAITAIMRKLIVLANAPFKNVTPWQPKLA